jgi:fructokinase
MCALDLLVRGDEKRASIIGFGGSCGNVLTILSFLGWKAYPAAVFGQDPEAETAIQDMRRFQVRTDFILTRRDLRTPIVVERLATHGSPRPHSFEFTCPICGTPLPDRKTIPDELVNKALKQVPSAAVCYLDRATPAAVTMAKAYRQRGALVVFEPPRVKETVEFEAMLELAHVVKYSDEQLSLVDREIAATLEIKTLGNKGLQYRHGAGTNWQTSPPIHLKNITDSTGAGDWCTAGILYAIGWEGSRGLSNRSDAEVFETIRFGQALGTLNCMYLGARGLMYAATRKEVLTATRHLLDGYNVTLKQSFKQKFQEYQCQHVKHA